MTGLQWAVEMAAVGVLVLVVAGLVWTVRRDDAFQAEWRAYVTAYNEGRPVPPSPPRFAQVARSLAHNQRADALLSSGLGDVDEHSPCPGSVARRPSWRVCESCRRAPVEVLVTFTDGAMFGVCAPCAAGAVARYGVAS